MHILVLGEHGFVSNGLVSSLTALKDLGVVVRHAKFATPGAASSPATGTPHPHTANDAHPFWPNASASIISSRSSLSNDIPSLEIDYSPDLLHKVLVEYDVIILVHEWGDVSHVYAQTEAFMGALKSHATGSTPAAHSFLKKPSYKPPQRTPTDSKTHTKSEPSSPSSLDNAGPSPSTTSPSSAPAPLFPQPPRSKPLPRTPPPRGASSTSLQQAPSTGAVSPLTQSHSEPTTQTHSDNSASTTIPNIHHNNGTPFIIKVSPLGQEEHHHRAEALIAQAWTHYAFVRVAPIMQWLLMYEPNMMVDKERDNGTALPPSSSSHASSQEPNGVRPTRTPHPPSAPRPQLAATAGSVSKATGPTRSPSFADALSKFSNPDPPAPTTSPSGRSPGRSDYSLSSRSISSPLLSSPTHSSPLADTVGEARTPHPPPSQNKPPPLSSSTSSTAVKTPPSLPSSSPSTPAVQPPWWTADTSDSAQDTSANWVDASDVIKAVYNIIIYESHHYRNEYVLSGVQILSLAHIDKIIRERAGPKVKLPGEASADPPRSPSFPSAVPSFNSLMEFLRSGKGVTPCASLEALLAPHHALSDSSASPHPFVFFEKVTTLTDFLQRHHHFLTRTVRRSIGSGEMAALPAQGEVKFRARRGTKSDMGQGVRYICVEATQGIINAVVRSHSYLVVANGQTNARPNGLSASASSSAVSDGVSSPVHVSGSARKTQSARAALRSSAPGSFRPIVSPALLEPVRTAVPTPPPAPPPPPPSPKHGRKHGMPSLNATIDSFKHRNTHNKSQSLRLILDALAATGAPSPLTDDDGDPYVPDSDFTHEVSVDIKHHDIHNTPTGPVDGMSTWVMCTYAPRIFLKLRVQFGLADDPPNTPDQPPGAVTPS
eukprot:TRINITY_DN8578_c0_g1_i4.p1 TRINITY_DN8578_c0_g1~~TRINITY_DN8578_c0_g1_i4.p1  ORF type:complete len:883 (+),score=210.25 TRINITY_DN8578_c0_g1_i4:210-2858(+)